MAVGTSIGHLLPTRFEVQIASKCIGRFSESGRLPVAQHLGPVAANAHQAALDANEVASAPRAAAKPFDAPFPRAWISAVAIFFVPGFKSLPDALTRQIEQAGPAFPEGRGITAADLERVALVDAAEHGVLAARRGRTGAGAVAAGHTDAVCTCAGACFGLLTPSGRAAAW